MNDIKMLKGRVEPWEELIQKVSDMETLYDLGIEENDQCVEKELNKLLYNAQK